MFIERGEGDHSVVASPRIYAQTTHENARKIICVLRVAKQAHEMQYTTYNTSPFKRQVFGHRHSSRSSWNRAREGLRTRLLRNQRGIGPLTSLILWN